MRFKIHSISDIITNSSSETFCFIYSEDISKVLKVLSPYFGTMMFLMNVVHKYMVLFKKV